MPPIDGLQLICPSVSIECVSSRVDAPMRAEASAASVPAWPPPTTMTSKCRGNCMRPLLSRADCIFPRARRPFAVAPTLAHAGVNHFRVIDAVFEMTRPGDDEAERSVERLEPRLRGDPDGDSGPDRGGMGQGANHRLAAHATTARRHRRQHPAD